MISKQSIFNMFGRSPIRPLQKHMEKVYLCANELHAFFIATEAEKWEEAGKLQAAIANLEKEADDLKQDLRLNLPGGLFLPVHRGDVLELITTQDSIANRARDIAGLVYGRQMQIPVSLRDQFNHYLRRNIDAVLQAQKAILELDELLETGFSGHETKIIAAMIYELDQIEHETDEIQINIRRGLYALERELPPIDVMFLYKIIERVGELADGAHRVGGHLQLLLAR